MIAAFALSACEPSPIEEAKERVSARMKDPGSAQFEGVEICNHDRSVIKGEVNAKNSFGGYTGFEQFFHSDYTTVLMSEASTDSWVEWIARCYGPEIAAESRRSVAEIEAKLGQ